MINVVNDVKSFIEKETGEIYIYGSGNAGYWTGYYMNRCGIKFEGYIDKGAENDKVMCNDHCIYPLKKLKELSGIRTRLIISPSVYKEITAELLWLDHLWNLDLLCAIPHYSDVIDKKEVYNINKFLGYFRRRLFKGEIPTIISNTCVAGHIYEAFNMPIISPTINTGMDALDYIKFCKNLKHYTSVKPTELYWQRATRKDGLDMNVYVSSIDDIRVYFAHIDSEKGLLDRWEMMCSMINWNRIIFIMEEQIFGKPISSKACEEFANLEGKKLLFQTVNSFGNKGDGFVFSPNTYIMVRREPAMENYLDLLEWMNADE